MNDVHLGAVDLNLLVALDALLTERHVTKAATRVGISQSAMSHALQRLRALLGDPLLVRTSGGMLPTPRGAALGPPIRAILGDLARALAPPERFDPATVARTFIIATADYGELVVLPPLLAALAEAAPRVDLTVRTVPGEPQAALEAGEVDLVLGLRPAKERVFAQRLFDDRFVCILRRGHPLARPRALTLARFVAASHVMIAVQGTPGGPVDDALAARGLARRVAVRVPHFLVAPLLVAESDLLLTAPERVARKLEGAFGLVVLEPPLKVPGFALWQAWHERQNADPAHVWLRATLARAVGAVTVHGRRGPKRRLPSNAGKI